MTGMSTSTRIQSQLLSVGFVASGVSPRHAGFRAVLRVPRGHLDLQCRPRFEPVRLRSALCSQKIMGSRVDDSLVLQSVEGRRALLAGGVDKPTEVTLDLPNPAK